MSLINDALKHARQIQQENPPPTPPLQFRPVEPGSPVRSPLLWAGLAFGLIVLAALGGLAVWFVSQQSAAGLDVAARTESLTPATAHPSAEPNPPFTPALAVTPKPVEVETNPPAAAVSVEPVVPPPPPKIQGIAFHQTHPAAIVNGRTVVVGDRVSGFRVLAITRSTVTLGNNTATNVLSLSE